MTGRPGRKTPKRKTPKRRPAGATRKSKPRPKQRPAAPRRYRYYKWGAVLLALLLAPLASLLVWAVLPGPGSGEQVAIDWPVSPAGARAAGERLAHAGLVRSPRLFAAYLALVRPPRGLAAGPHLLQGGISPRDLVQRLARLPSRPKVRATIPEGYNYLQVGARLQHLGICSASAFEQAVTDHELLRKLRIHGPSAEGYLFPATYSLFVDSSPARVVYLLVRQTRRRLRKLDRKHGGALSRLEQKRGWGEREVLTMASIVEKETGRADERRKVASVYFNRLDDPDFRPLHTLQADPTAGYGCLVEPQAAVSCAGYAGRITPAMLRDPDNPYNTYRHPGLPPGPIANPGEGAISAVIDPAHTSYLFFVANGAGGHTFTRTFEAHNAAIRHRWHDAGP